MIPGEILMHKRFFFSEGILFCRKFNGGTVPRISVVLVASKKYCRN